MILRCTRETKNTIHYEEPQSDQPLIIGTLNLQKSAAERLGNPQSILVTVESA